eukprot:TRINITY_DN13914_c0_g2_i1.p1 TRINITY_DN13914_c0_g2~~TRINITY_DN13914_c0_g2_i1.p1  ORF type:complete len:1103 (+),score=290.37 TRINITY_DN13914_c0_g2_i1:192-3500(+)
MDYTSTPSTGALKTRLVFRTNWAVKRDEEVRVVGDCAELGSWNPLMGHVLSRIRESGRCWTSRPGVLVPTGKEVQYKYALVCRLTGELIQWQAQEGNRAVLPTGLKQLAEDDNGDGRRMELETETETRTPPLLPTKRSSNTVIEGSPNPVSRQPAPSDSYGDDSPRPSHKVSNTSISCMMHVPEQTALGREDVVMIVFRRLPLSVAKDETTGDWKVVKTFVRETSVLPFMLHLTKPDWRESAYQVKFVGLPGVVGIKDPAEKKRITEVLAPHNCIPVFVDSEVHDQHSQFSQDFMWPVFNGMKVFDEEDPDNLSNVTMFNEAQWKCYQAFNNAYAEVIEARRTPETLVWVHDYELLLVPRYVSLRCPDCALGMFLHCAFPSSELLSCLPNREEILQGMLCSRVVYFQIFDYMRNFISCCSLLLGARHTFQRGGIMQVEHDGKSVVVGADHFVIPYSHLVRKLSSDKVGVEVEKLRTRFQGKIIIGSYDKCDSTAGLMQKLRIFHQFLSEYCSYRKEVVLVQFVSSTEWKPGATGQSRHGGEHLQLRKDLEAQAEETNKKFAIAGQPPLVNLVFEEGKGKTYRIATLNAIDILLDTSINDGLNLVPFLFYVAHSQDQKGVAIVSEFAGCSSALTGAFKVNPHSPRAVMTALDTALSLPFAQQAERFGKDHSYVSTQMLVKWMENSVTELKRVKEQGSVGQTAGFDASFRMGLQAKGGVRPLDHNQVIECYRKAKSRVLFFDAEGTIASKAAWQLKAGARAALLAEGTPPDSKMIDCLQTLANDRNNTVVVVSGRNSDTLEEWFGQVAGLGLCAEHGFHFLPPYKLQRLQGRRPVEDCSRWFMMVDTSSDADNEWKTIASEVMKLYVKRVQGSIVEYKASGIAWNYRDVGAPDLINQLAMELARFLDPNQPEGLLRGYPARIVCGKGYVEVLRTDVNKGVACHKVLKEAQEVLGNSPDFVLCIGDDRSDEDMFAAVSKFYRYAVQESEPATPHRLQNSPNSTPMTNKTSMRGSDDAPTPMTAKQKQASISNLTKGQYWTVTVGRKPSNAKHFVRDVGEVSDLLTKLSQQSVVSSFSRYSSMPTLTGGLAGLALNESGEIDEQTG